MSKEIIKYTEEIGKLYIEISKLRAEREVLEVKRWNEINKEI